MFMQQNVDKVFKTEIYLDMTQNLSDRIKQKKCDSMQQLLFQIYPSKAFWPGNYLKVVIK